MRVNIPRDLRGKDYYRSLGEFRDRAFVASNYSGRRRRIGAFTFGLVVAAWETEAGGTAILRDEGLRYGEHAVRLHPTTLKIDDHEVHPEAHFIDTFELELGEPPYIWVFRRIAPQFLSPNADGTLMQSSPVTLDHNLALAEASDEDRNQIYHELQRGASGLY
jgi:hypothetical protein